MKYLKLFCCFHLYMYCSYYYLRSPWDTPSGEQKQQPALRALIPDIWSTESFFGLFCLLSIAFKYVCCCWLQSPGWDSSYCARRWKFTSLPSKPSLGSYSPSIDNIVSKQLILTFSTSALGKHILVPSTSNLSELCLSFYFILWRIWVCTELSPGSLLRNPWWWAPRTIWAAGDQTWVGLIQGT